MLLLSVFSTILIILAFYVLFTKDLVNIVLAVAVFSITICICYLLMDAPDVAMTEAALGACITTIVMFNLLRSMNIDFVSCETKSKDTNCLLPVDFSINKFKYIASALLSLAILIILIYCGIDMHEYGNAETALHNHLSQYYISKTSSDIGIPSYVAAILGSYRGFDTMGETLVVFIAAASVILILNSEDLDINEVSKYNLYDYELKNYDIIHYLVKRMFPLIVVYGLYIQLCGKVSPGGGFQAGAIVASAVAAISYFSTPEKLLRYAFATSALGVLIYICTGVLTTMLGGEFLNYYALTSSAHLAQTIGILAIEIGVGLTVFSAMVLIYFSFS